VNSTAAFWAEFATGAAAVAAVQTLRREGFERLDAITPYPLPELEDSIGLGRPRLLLGAVLGAGCAGGLLAYLLMRWTAAVDYPLDVGGRPLDSFITDIPIIFESSLLCAALAAFALTLLQSGMPRLDHPLEAVPGFERTTIDRFWVGVDPIGAPDGESVSEVLERLGALRVHTPLVARTQGSEPG
jgi:hypothetical protein